MKKPLLAVILGLCANLALADVADDQRSIQQLMQHTFARPDAPLDVGPVTVSGEHAVAGWLQDQRGGRALLRKGAQGWRVVLCAGDSLLEARTLRSAGLNESEADRLSQATRSSEQGLPAERVRQFALFQGVVKAATDAAHGNH